MHANVSIATAPAEEFKGCNKYLIISNLMIDSGHFPGNAQDLVTAPMIHDTTMRAAAANISSVVVHPNTFVI